VAVWTSECLITVPNLSHQTKSGFAGPKRPPDLACPNLADQRKLFALLKSEEIEVQLTEGDLMDREALVSVLILHPSRAEDFSVGPEA
jgi:cobalamin-dependent methionine synthase I